MDRNPGLKSTGHIYARHKMAGRNKDDRRGLLASLDESDDETIFPAAQPFSKGKKPLPAAPPKGDAKIEKYRTILFFKILT